MYVICYLGEQDIISPTKMAEKKYAHKTVNRMSYIYTMVINIAQFFMILYTLHYFSGTNSLLSQANSLPVEVTKRSGTAK